MIDIGPKKFLQWTLFAVFTALAYAADGDGDSDGGKGGNSQGGAAPARGNSTTGSAAKNSTSGGSGGSGGGGGGSGGEEAPSQAEIFAALLNNNMSYWLGWTWLSVLGALFIYQVLFHGYKYIRKVVCLNNDTQRYFFTPNATWGAFKKHFADAPLFRTRHHREFKLSSAINIGTLPSRIQTLYLTLYVGTNILFTVWKIDWNAGTEAWTGELINRTGTLAVMNMLPLFLLAWRNNPFIKWCGISFDTFNLVHRWIGRVVVLEALVHTLAWLIPQVQEGGWASFGAAIAHSQFILGGTLGTASFLMLMLHSPSPLRHAFYETFLHLHIAFAAVAVAGMWYHCKDMPQIQIIKAVIGLWVAERVLRLIRLAYRNIGAGGTKVEVEALPGEAMRVTFKMARPWNFQPGQHVYLYMPTVSLWMSHPFSLAWSEEEEDPMAAYGSTEKLAMNRQDILGMRKTTMSTIIRRRTGFTSTLWKKADLAAGGKFTTTAFVEGPYSGEDLSSYGTAMLFAAGVGITHQVPHVRALVAGYANGTVATRKLTLVWIIQSPEHLEWIRPWMTTILSMPKRREVLRILLFVTRPRSTKEIHSPSSSVQMFPGKPNVQALIDQEMETAVGAGVVTCCGTGSLADDLRRAVRMRQQVWDIDFREESFSW